MQPTKAKGAAAMSSSRADADDEASSGGKASGVASAGGAIDELPLHLTEKILHSFSPLASARLATVCKSWATAVSDRLARPVPHLFVYLPADITKSDRRGIVVSVSLDLDTVCPPAATVIPNRVLLADTNGLRCIGAMPSGCLAFENPWRCDTRVLLVNPITGALQTIDVDKLRRNPVIAASGGADSFVCHGPGGLELWRQAGGGDEWSKLPVAAVALRTDGIVSVANCNGRFYILDRDGQVSLIDAAAPPPLRVEKLPVASLFGQFARPCPAAVAPAAQGHLLGSDGEVLFVRRVLGFKKAGEDVELCNHDAAEADLLPVVGFEVYRLDVKERRWKEVKKLGSNRSLFVSPRSAFAVRSSETEGCRANCIYFVDKKRYCPLCNHYGKPDVCRVSSPLPSVFCRALGKESLCRVPLARHSAYTGHSAKRCFAECQASDTRQRGVLPSVRPETLGKEGARARQPPRTPPAVRGRP